VKWKFCEIKNKPNNQSRYRENSFGLLNFRDKYRMIDGRLQVILKKNIFDALVLTFECLSDKLSGCNF